MAGLDERPQVCADAEQGVLNHVEDHLWGEVVMGSMACRKLEPTIIQRHKKEVAGARVAIILQELCVDLLWYLMCSGT